MPETTQPSAVLRPKYIVFAVIAAMMTYVFVHRELDLFNPNHPIWQHYEPYKWWLLTHGSVGGLALILVPLQFSDRLRARYAKVHRIIGRIYVVGALVLAPAGVYMQYLDEAQGASRSFTVATVVDAAILMITTSLGFLFAYKRMIQQHRQWMTRSFAVALVFLEVRVILGLTGWERLGMAATETVVWTCVAFSVVVGDIALQIQELLRMHPASARVRSVSA